MNLFKRKKVLLGLLSICLSIMAQAQHRKVRPLLWVGPMDSVTIYGVNIAPFVFDLPEGANIHGINVEGPGISFLLGLLPQNPINQVDSFEVDRRHNVNGISIGALGLWQRGRLNGMGVTSSLSFIYEVNGLNIAGHGSFIYKLNGLMVTPFWSSILEMRGAQMGLFNSAKRAKGIQIGLFNRADDLKGLQIGLWNKNNKRQLPLINW